MADRFSYDRDIAPMRRNFFQNGMSSRDIYNANLYVGASGDTLRRANDTEDRMINPIIDALESREELDRRRRMDDLNFERSRFELKQKKREARLERQARQGNTTITTELDSIIQGAYDDPAGAQNEMMRFVTKYGSNIKDDASLQASIQTANSAIELQQKRKEEDNRSKAAMAQIKITQGDYEAASTLAAELPSNYSSLVAANIEAAKEKEKKDEETLAKNENTRQTKAQNDARKAQDSLAKEHIEKINEDLEKISSTPSIENTEGEPIEQEPINYFEILSNRSRAIIYKRSSELAKSSPAFAMAYGSSTAEIEKSLADPERGKLLVQDINNYLVNMRTGVSVQESGVDLNAFGD